MDILYRIATDYLLLLVVITNILNIIQCREFFVHRMSQFDVDGTSYGCRASSLSLEAKALKTANFWRNNRQCVIARFQDFTIDEFNRIRQKAGGLVLLLPNNVASMSLKEKEALNALEYHMMLDSISIPVYFSPYNAKLEKIISDMTIVTSGENSRSSTFNDIILSLSGNGYQVSISGVSHSANKNSKVPIIQGELVPQILTDDIFDKVHNKLPSIIITTQLKTFGIYNEYPFNADTAILLTLADAFSKFYNSVYSSPKYRLLFLLTESEHLLNYQGTKKWLDENNYDQNIDFVICLDTAVEILNGNTKNLYVHVSKPPKENTPLNNFFTMLRMAALKYGNISLEEVHKKINLADHTLAWKHERFSFKRLPAFTLSSLNSPRHPTRKTIFRQNEKIILEQIETNTKILAEALACYIFSPPLMQVYDPELFTGSMRIKMSSIKAYTNVKSALYNNDLKNIFEKYLHNVKLIYNKPDVRDPDFMFYEGYDAILNIYHVKPAIFDLFLTIIIIFYLIAVYFIIRFFPSIYVFILNKSHVTRIDNRKKK